MDGRMNWMDRRRNKRTDGRWDGRTNGLDGLDGRTDVKDWMDWTGQTDRTDARAGRTKGRIDVTEELID